MRVLVVLLLGLILGCARSEPATVEVGPEPTTGPREEPPAPRAAPVSTATAPDDHGYPRSCWSRGVEPLNPCPRGLPWIDGEEGGVMPEAAPYCCASGPVHESEIQPCFAAERTSLYCGPDPDGKAAARARIEAWAKKYGEPCKDPEFRQPFTAQPGFQKICAERGYP